MPFVIDKLPVNPEEMIRVPYGTIVHAGFVGSTAHVWIMVQVGEDRAMGVIVLPNGGPYDLQETEEFFPATHAKSFEWKSKIKTKDSMGVAFHVFTWAPKPPAPTALN